MSAKEVRGVLSRLLSSGPMLGARLRPLLIEEFRHATGRDLEPFLRSFGKFSAFLADNADLIEVCQDGRSADIRVSLRSAEQPSRALSQSRRRFSSELWRAFTNPDKRRSRFYHRDTHEVVHYLTTSSNHLDTSFANRVSGDDRFIEIEYAHASEQSRWMQDFLDSARNLPESTRRVAAHFVGIDYDSSVNTAFESALGPHGYEWRHFRALRVSEHIEQWAEKHTISPVPGGFTDDAIPSATERSIAPVLDPTHSEMSEQDLRNGLQSLICTMSFAELKQVLVPASVRTVIDIKLST